jgi:hypothetical protein
MRKLPQLAASSDATGRKSFDRLVSPTDATLTGSIA